MDTSMTTELDAINIMLQTIGESPVNSLETTGLSDLTMAINLLKETSRGVQSEGWEFNTEEITLTPDVDGHINIPASSIKADPVDSTLKYIRRGDKLYNKTNNTFIFNSSVKLELVWFLNFEDLPETARRYIAIKAARRFQNRVMGSDVVYAYTKEDEADARQLMIEDELDNGRFNLGKDSYTMAAYLVR